MVTIIIFRSSHQRQCFKQGLFTWPAISLDKQSLSIKTKIQKSAVGLGFSVTSVGFAYFVIPIVWSRPFLISLMNFSFMLSHLHQNLSDHLIIKQILTMLEFQTHTESNQFKVDIKSRTRLTWNTDMWLRNLPKTACATLRSFQISNHTAKFSSWKLITARWILRQHNTNAITTYFK